MAAFRVLVLGTLIAAFHAEIIEEDDIGEALNLLQVKANALPAQLTVESANNSASPYRCAATSNFATGACQQDQGSCTFSADPHMSTNFVKGQNCNEFHMQGTRYMGRSKDDEGATWDIQVYSCNNGGSIAGYGRDGVMAGSWSTIHVIGIRYKGVTLVGTRQGEFWVNGERTGAHDNPIGIFGRPNCIDLNPPDDSICQSISFDGSVGVRYRGRRTDMVLPDKLSGCAYPGPGNAVPDHVPFSKIMFTKEQTTLFCTRCQFFREHCKHPPDTVDLDPRDVCATESNVPFEEAEEHCEGMRETHFYDDCLMDYCTLSKEDFDSSEEFLKEFENDQEENQVDAGPTTTFPPAHLWPPEYWLPNCDTVSEPDRVPFPLNVAKCTAWAPFWKPQGASCDTSKDVLHFDQWSQNGGKAGYFQVEFERPISMNRFEMECERAPAFGIRYSNDGRVWRTAALTRTNKVNPRLDWEGVAAYKFWRFEIRDVPGAWRPGPWYKNFKFYETPGPYCQTILLPHCSIVEGDYYQGEAKCEGFFQNEAGMQKQGQKMTKCMTGTADNGERFNANSMWKNAQIGVSYYQIETETPQEFVGFSMETDNWAPNFYVAYSPDGERWNTAWRSDDLLNNKGGNNRQAGHDPHAHWDPLGRWKFWKMELDGRSYAGGSQWMRNLKWFGQAECQEGVPPICAQARVRPYDGEEAECNAHAKHWMPKRDEWCNVEVGMLRFHPWTHFGGEAAWWQTHFEDHVMILTLDYRSEHTNTQKMNAYQILFSDNGHKWGIAYEDLLPIKTGANTDVIHLRWPSVGKKHYWRYQYVPDGQVSNNPNAWYGFFTWGRADECLWTTTPTTTTTAADWATLPPTTTEDRGDVVVNPNIPIDAEDVCVPSDMLQYYCTALAPSWGPAAEKQKGSCNTATTNLHFSGWQERPINHGGGGGGSQTCRQAKCAAYWQVDTFTPRTFCRFSVRCADTPDYEIKYSDGGAPGSDPDTWVWKVAAECKKKHSQNQIDRGCEWDSVGPHRYWRLEPKANSGQWWYDANFWEGHEYGGSAAPTDLCENDDYNLQFNSVVNSNLGGQGPDFGGDENIRYGNVLRRGTQDIDMIVVSNSPYTGKGAKNGLVGEGSGAMGVVNVWTGTDVDVTFKFVKSGTDEPVVVDNFLFSVLDMDLGRKGKGQESLTFDAAGNGCARSYRTNPSEINVEGSVYSASTHGTKHDNPSNIKQMTEQQEARSVSFRCGGVSEFKANFKVGAGQGARMFHFAGASSVACPPERSSKTSTTTPGPNCPAPLPSTGKPNKVKTCGVWRDPHVVRNFYDGPAFDQYHEGIVDIIGSRDGSLHMQAFMCDSGAGTTTMNALAIRNDGDYISFVRGPKTKSNCGFPCVIEPQPAPEDMWIISVNGHVQDWNAMPRAWPGGTWMMHLRQKLGNVPLNKDGQSICAGDHERRWALRIGMERNWKHEGKVRFMTQFQLDMQEEFVAAVGLCGTSAGRADVGYENAIFTTMEMASLCDICGLSKDIETTGGCTPPASFHGAGDPDEVCRQGGVPFAEAQEKCGNLNNDDENDQIFYHACMVEYCASGGDPVEVELANEEDHFEKFHDKIVDEENHGIDPLNDDPVLAEDHLEVQEAPAEVPHPCGGGLVPPGLLDGTFKFTYTRETAASTFNKCYNTCRAQGGAMARPFSQEILQEIVQIAKGSCWGPWTDMEEENTWRLPEGGEPYMKTRHGNGNHADDAKIINNKMCYKNWNGGQPNQQAGHQCFDMRGANGGWDDENCNTNKICVCEF